MSEKEAAAAVDTSVIQDPSEPPVGTGGAIYWQQIICQMQLDVQDEQKELLDLVMELQEENKTIKSDRVALMA